MTADWISDQLRERQKPTGRRPAMYQRWGNLLFLHWQCDPDEIARRLPAGLSLDLFEGAAWIGIVPFFMRAVRPVWSPPIPGLSNFLELNLRTYVRDSNGRPGVWFFSLDANQLLAIWAGRRFFSLAYVQAKMRARTTPDMWIEYESSRAGVSLEYRYRPSGAPFEAKPGSLEFFLIERYRLFAFRRGSLLSGRVYHEPYQLRAVSVDRADTGLFSLNGLSIPNGKPEHQIFASGVDVSVYSLERR
jgi:uncharacterized protein YqjF (DUF2071 family)